MRAHLVLPELSCDCPARLHDKERPLELVSLPPSPAWPHLTSLRCFVLQENIISNNDTEQHNYGYSSHFDF